MNHEDRFEELMRRAAREYRVPPPVEPRLEAMWSHIDEASFGGGTRQRRRASWFRGGLGIAAALLLGVAFGRYSAAPRSELAQASPPVAEEPVATSSVTVRASDADAAPYRQATTRHLGQTAALLSALPGEVRRGAPDAAFVAQANDLLSTTRLLLDSPVAGDSEVRVLLYDLELVLAQIARLSVRRNPQEVQLITEALETRDVLPRLRTAVADLPPYVGL